MRFVPLSGHLDRPLQVPEMAEALHYREFHLIGRDAVVDLT